ncbi:MULTISPECIES: VOC family protein [Ramlibacter]|uniref:VOC family protein n=1 Tax=Ramlibacter pinisoli TaxID=2682844 RepID=A0A6N8IUN0_9BURK|nr:MULTISPECIES: VOC family protein [Ramlibacter]MBA2965436.1 VOC family protein [Ramlibacter sp. CGMCC 1.13660]MVQ30402.1 VOC family protein [Ramlibacter pinisoli]
MPARLDHLVIAADTLAQGAAWCERTLGVVPGPGGQHPLMGTHNQLLRIATVNYPRAYCEVIAVDPQARPPGRRRWFDLDDAALRQDLRQRGPRLVHWVAQVPDVQAAVAALARLGIDRGTPTAASRMTPRGLLEWRITVRDDGARLFDGCLPTLIEWGDTHPASALPDSGVTLHGLAVRHPQAAELREALDAIGLDQVGVEGGPASVCATLHGPRGPVRLQSGA